MQNPKLRKGRITDQTADGREIIVDKVYEVSCHVYRKSSE